MSQSMDTGSSASNHVDTLYSYDEALIQQYRREKPWLTSPTYYKDCRISTLAAMKMLKHALAGVTEGRSERGVPVEVMGLMLGKPDGNTIVVTDVFPLPVKGIEYEVQVMEKSMVFMTAVQDALELRRNDRFVGWYHSHPFEVESWSHCHLSSTDVGTQLAWQFSSPWWLAVVVDPLRSLLRNMPELGAYRCYPATYDPPTNAAPDGTVVTNEQWRLQRWGNSSSRYYELPITYFTSSASDALLRAMTQGSLWSTPLIPSLKDTESHQVTNRILTTMISALDQSQGASLTAPEPAATRLSPRNPPMTRRAQLLAEHKCPSNSTQVTNTALDDLTKQAVRECCSVNSQILKTILFNFARREEQAEQAAQSEIDGKTL